MKNLHMQFSMHLDTDYSLKQTTIQVTSTHN